MKKTLTASQEFFYDGKTRMEGEKFEAVDPDASILVCLGRATESAPDPIVEAASARSEPIPAPKLETADLKAEEPAEEETPPKKKRQYLRRDMTAES